MKTYPRSRQYKTRKKKWPLVIIILLILLALLLGWIFFVREDKAQEQPAAGEGGAQAETESAPKPLINLQPTVDTWVVGQSGEYGIMVYDPDNSAIIASHNSGTQFFTASIYKLYTVYLALEDIESGRHSLDEPFRFNKTRQQCLHDAIHTSDSPCAEALLNEIGQAEATSRLKQLGFTGTEFPAFVTTAQDAMTILQRLHARMDLNEDSTKLMLEAMKTQIYRDGLPKGMSQATVYDKVGFSETPHYHDVGIVTLPNGRDYLVAIFSKGAKSSQIADLGQTIYQALQ